MAQAKYVVIDGMDGAGKTSLFEAIKRQFSPWQLGERSTQFQYTREPGGTDLAEKIRELILHMPMSPYTEMCLFIGARDDVRKQTVTPALARGVHVISDRSDSSTFAYQIRGREHQDLEELFWLMNHRLLPQPTMYIFLDLDPKVAEMRLKNKAGNRFDKQDATFFARIRQGFLDFSL